MAPELILLFLGLVPSTHMETHNSSSRDSVLSSGLLRLMRHIHGVHKSHAGKHTLNKYMRVPNPKILLYNIMYIYVYWYSPNVFTVELQWCITSGVLHT